MYGKTDKEFQLREIAESFAAENLSIGALVAILRAAAADNITDRQLTEIADAAIQKCSSRYDYGDTSAAEDPGELPQAEGIKPQAVDWLIPGWIPRNTITLLGADGGTGKTWLECNIAAAISSGGRCLLDAAEPAREPGTVLMFNAEDDFSRVIRNRLEVCGADLSRIRTMELDDKRLRDLKIDSDLLGSFLAKYKPTLLILDPLQSFLASGLEISRRNDMRNVMQVLLGYCKEYSVTALVAMHTNKRTGASGRKRLADSSDLWDIARSVLLAGFTNDGEQTRYVSQEKSSYGKYQDSVLFQIGDAGLTYIGRTTLHDADFVSSDGMERRGRKPDALEEAKQFIIDALEDYGGFIDNKELWNLAKNDHISDATFRRARKELLDAKRIEKKPSGARETRKVIYRLTL